MRYIAALSRSAGPFLLGVALSTCARNPVTGKQELAFVSESQEIQMGKEYAAQVKQEMGVYPDSDLQAYVSSIGLKMARASERPNLPWEYTVVPDPVVNAFALPGGHIFITSGILAHMNSEAELASVLGHETGHVTARHSVQQMTRQQLAQIGLVAGSIASSKIAENIGAISSGLGILFLKYSRDDETQADGLGFRYSEAQGYDGREMAEMFKTLQRVGGGGSIPEWQSTHPDPGNRVEKTEERLQALKTPNGTVVNRDVFLSHVDGIIFGDDPRDGYFVGNTFYHPNLKFRFDYPSGWKMQNGQSAVVGVSAGQDAMIQISSAGNVAPGAAVQQFAKQEGVTAGQASQQNINGNSAAMLPFSVTAQDPPIRGIATYISYGGSTYQILAYSVAGKFASYDRLLRQAVGSFTRLNDPAAIDVLPDRVVVAKVPRGMTLAEFNQQFPSTIPIEQLAIINGIEASTALQAGQSIKRVTGGKRVVGATQ